MILTIVQDPDPRLTQRAEPVTRFDKSLMRQVAQMRETLRHHQGAGLAAPQVGIPLRIILAVIDRQAALAMTLINPRILRAEGVALADEGCLSIPGYVARAVPRATAIRYEAQTVSGLKFRRQARGWFARVIQHEIDHLNGVLIRDRVIAPDLWQRWPDAREVAA